MVVSETHAFGGALKTTLAMMCTFSYFSFSLAALASNGTLSLAVCVDHFSPSFLAISPMVIPG